MKQLSESLISDLRSLAYSTSFLKEVEHRRSTQFLWKPISRFRRVPTAVEAEIRTHPCCHSGRLRNRFNRDRRERTRLIMAGSSTTSVVGR